MRCENLFVCLFKLSPKVAYLHVLFKNFHNELFQNEMVINFNFSLRTNKFKYFYRSYIELNSLCDAQ
jgi:hypothetical protein